MESIDRSIPDNYMHDNGIEHLGIQCTIHIAGCQTFIFTTVRCALNSLIKIISLHETINHNREVREKRHCPYPIICNFSINTASKVILLHYSYVAGLCHFDLLPLR